jgi:pimeloyl-ACP methyl ester carboxylesterase
MVWIKKIGKWVAIGMALVLLLLTFMYRGELSSEEVTKKYLTPESQFLDIDGMRVHVRVLGEGEPVVLLHGSFSSLHTWDIWQQELSPYFQTISLDFPGHGLTGPDSLKRYTTLDYSHLVLQVAEKLQLNEFHLAGNSMGGAVAMQVASDHPDRVLSLNLIDAAGSPPSPSDSTSKDNKRGGAWIFKLANHPFFSSILLSFTPRFLFGLNLKQVYADENKVSEEVVTRYYELMLREGNRKATLDRLQLPRNASIRFDRLTMPTLILWGAKDNWIPLSQGEKLKQAIPGANLVVFEEAGHVPMEEIPTESVVEYLRFLGVELRENYLQPFKQMANAS